MTNLRVGDAFPDFELPDHDGKPVRLSSLRGQKIVLYFYPKDDTPGCTTQACDLRDRSDARVLVANESLTRVDPLNPDEVVTGFMIDTEIGEPPREVRLVALRAQRLQQEVVQISGDDVSIAVPSPPRSMRLASSLSPRSSRWASWG